MSEALYLSDPEGNGIEIYRDRPREQWPQRDGKLQMATLALDLRDLLGELDSDQAPSELPALTTIGHIHLQVSDLAAAEAFYSGILGFEVMVRGYPGALFLAAGGYHHHLGLNTWHSAGTAPASRPTVGLEHYEVLLPNPTALEQVRHRLIDAGIWAESRAAGRSSQTPRATACYCAAPPDRQVALARL